MERQVVLYTSAIYLLLRIGLLGALRSFLLRPVKPYRSLIERNGSIL